MHRLSCMQQGLSIRCQLYQPYTFALAIVLRSSSPLGPVPTDCSLNVYSFGMGLPWLT